MAASMWIYMKAVVCNGQNDMKNKRIFKLRSITEAFNSVCDDALDVHAWVSEQSISLQEAKVLEALQYALGFRASSSWDVMVLGTNKPQQ